MNSSLIELLNKAIQAWWKPRWEIYDEIKLNDDVEHYDILYKNGVCHTKSINDLLAIESWLLKWIYDTEDEPWENSSWQVMELAILLEEQKICKLTTDLSAKLSS